MRTSTGLGLATSAVMITAGSAKVAAIEPMRMRAAHLMYSVNAYRLIGAAEVGAAIALVAGTRRPAIGAVAAGGVAALMTGAVASHRRVHDATAELLPAVGVGALAASTAAAFAAGAFR